MPGIELPRLRFQVADLRQWRYARGCRLRGMNRYSSAISVVEGDRLGRGDVNPQAIERRRIRGVARAVDAAVQIDKWFAGIPLTVAIDVEEWFASFEGIIDGTIHN